MALETTPEWAAVAAAAARVKDADLLALVREEPERLARLRRQGLGLTIDAAKHRVDAAGLEALRALARARGVDDRRRRLLSGGEVNPTERRPALHPAARGGGLSAEAIARANEQRVVVRAFTTALREGRRTGASGRPIRSVVSVGIGGSDLGPRLIWEALKRRREPGMDVRFAANVDGAEINDALEGLDPETTLVVTVSKSFTTQETFRNAETARAWLVQALGAEAAAQHMAVVTARPDRAADFGVAADAIFPFDEGVGGRYSLWSAVSLAVDAGLEAGVFDALRAGAAAQDTAFAEEPLEANAACLLGALDVWNRNALGLPTRAVIPYARRLRLLPAYLQQLEMESNGKGVTLDGAPAGPTAPITWGAEGTNAQHAFFQQLHQGRDAVPVEFVGVLDDGEAQPEHQRILLSHMIAQGEAFLHGRDLDAATAEGLAAGLSDAEARALAPHRVCPGGRGSTTILLGDLAPETLGALIALYEHRVFVAGALWGINPFDQWGVELGKKLASSVLAELEGGGAATNRDPSTAALIDAAIAAGRESAAAR